MLLMLSAKAIVLAHKPRRLKSENVAKERPPQGLNPFHDPPRSFRTVGCAVLHGSQRTGQFTLERPRRINQVSFRIGPRERSAHHFNVRVQLID